MKEFVKLTTENTIGTIDHTSILKIITRAKQNE